MWMCSFKNWTQFSLFLEFFYFLSEFKKADIKMKINWAKKGEQRELLGEGVHAKFDSFYFSSWN